jgi:hypothetical protein
MLAGGLVEGGVQDERCVDERGIVWRSVDE